MDKVKHIKILFVSHEFSIGGSTVSLISLIHGLKSYENIEVTVLLPYKKGKKEKVTKLLEKNGINYKKIWYRRNYKSITEKYLLKYYIFDLMNILAVKKTQKYIEQEKFDIICSNSTGVDVGARAAQIEKVPHIYYIRETMEDDFNCEYRNKKQMKNLLEVSKYIIFISKAVEAYYLAKFRLQNTIQFYDGFILQDYYIGDHDILKGDKISFVQVGSFSDAKGTINTIELMHQLNQNGICNWSMEFIGRGSEKYVQRMRNLIWKYHLESQIIIGDFCLDMKSKLSKKDILIMNSRAEAFGRVTVEGMLAGCLVIGRYSCGTTEIIIDRVNGLAFEKNEEFLNVVKQIISEKEFYRKLARAGQNYVMRKFDCANTAGEFVKVLKECLE